MIAWSSSLRRVLPAPPQRSFSCSPHESWLLVRLVAGQWSLRSGCVEVVGSYTALVRSAGGVDSVGELDLDWARAAGEADVWGGSKECWRLS